MPRIDHGEIVTVVNLRLDVVVDGRALGEGSEHVECRERARGRLNPRCLRRHR
jgi:hypothetical protein